LLKIKEPLLRAVLNYDTGNHYAGVISLAACCSRIGFTRTQSFLAVVLEHALYGDLIFTIGLGRFFFTGAANL
jgi:hypothetical protein